MIRRVDWSTLAEDDLLNIPDVDARRISPPLSAFLPWRDTAPSFDSRIPAVPTTFASTSPRIRTTSRSVTPTKSSTSNASSSRHSRRPCRSMNAFSELARNEDEAPRIIAATQVCIAKSERAYLRRRDSRFRNRRERADASRYRSEATLRGPSPCARPSRSRWCRGARGRASFADRAATTRRGAIRRTLPAREVSQPSRATRGLARRARVHDVRAHSDRREARSRGAHRRIGNAVASKTRTHETDTSPPERRRALTMM
jgi:hypothetical protein